MDENRISSGDAKSQRRNFLSLAIAATAGAIATVIAKGNEALAGHDGTNIFHLGELNVGGAGEDPTRLSANVAFDALGPVGPWPPSAALMIFNGDGATSNKGWAVLAHGNAGAVGGVYGFSATGDGVRGSSESGTAVRAESSSPSQPALVANWTGPANSPHSGVAGSSTAGPGVHGLSPTTGVLGQASQLIPGGISLTDGTGVKGESGSGTGVQGLSSSGPGVDGRSSTGPGVRGRSGAAPNAPGVLGLGSPNSPGVGGVNETGPGVIGDSPSEGVIGRAIELGTETPASGIGVRGVSGSGTGVLGTSISGPGASGHSSSGVGVLGQSGGLEPGVRAHSAQGPGVEGSSSGGPGVRGIASQTGPGVEGFASTGTQPGVTGRPGVVGHASSTNSGVRGQSNFLAPAVIGEQLGPDGFAIWANAAQSGAIGLRTGNAQGGIALDVSGRARFTTAGNSTIDAKADSQAVSNSAVQANSNVIATLTSDPGDAQIAWVERNPGSGFVIHMTKKVGAATSFAYLITESA